MGMDVSLPIKFYAALAGFLLLLATMPPSWAQRPADVEAETSAAAVDASAVQQASERLEKAATELVRIRQQVEERREDDAQLVDLKLQTESVARSILDISVATRPQLDDIKARQTELGDPPAEGEPAESDIVKAERQRLTNERNELNALIAEAEKLSVEATRLSREIVEIRRTLFTSILLNRTPLSGALFVEAGEAAVVEMQSLVRAFSSWLRFSWTYKRIQLTGAVFLSLAAALIFFAGSKRLFAPLIERPLLSREPGYIRRMTVAFWSTVIPTAAAAAFAVSSYFFLKSFNVLRSDIAPIISLTLGVCVALVFLFSLTNAVLVPRHSSWRLVNVSDRGARRLRLALNAMATANLLDYLLEGVSVALGSAVILTAAKSFLASIIIGLILISMSFIRPMLRQGEPPESEGHRWPRFIWILLLAMGIGLIAATLLGYVVLARFVATQIVVTGAIIVTMYIGFLAGKAISKQEAFAETMAGRHLAKRYGFGQVALDQSGLVAGLVIYATLLVVFIPLVLLLWGFRIADIQSWAYRIFTEIKIGNISISILAILGGIALFIAGMIVTRWFQRWLDGNVMARSHVDAGVRNSIRTAVGYAGVALAGLIGISAAGIDLSSLALVAGALSLGIGFGLQNIVSNFVSGLILLAERPFKVGDWVVTGTTEGFVKRISVRATEIETFRRQSIIVPNSELINASVGNWTHRNRLGRSEIAIGASYDADPRRVMEILAEIVTSHPKVLKNPEPLVEFVRFGESSLDFEARFFLADLFDGIAVRNELRLQIFERFREEGIEIPFPQRSLRIHVDGKPEAGIMGAGTAAAPLPRHEGQTAAETQEQPSGPAKRPARRRKPE